MADWEEIKRLAADFQRAQLSSTAQRLSDRNCIEIVRKLSDLNLIDVIYTVDGKEYLTHPEIIKEIREELIVHGGRVNLVELQQCINVDFSHIESKVNEMVRMDRNLSLILGQLIDESYLDSLAEELNDQLQEQGQLTMAEITKTYDLPAEFLAEAIHPRLGNIIKGQVDDLDRDVIFTEAFVNRHRAKIRGAFSAITRPTTVSGIIQHFQLQERFFYRVVEELISLGRLAGSISGGRQEKAVYVPDIYTKAQNAWVDSFYAQNGYLEYDAVARIGVSDPKLFLKKRLKGETVEFLGTCCVGQRIQEQIMAEIEEALISETWVDIMPSLPSILSEVDGNQLINTCLKGKSGAVVLCDTIVASDKFVNQCSLPFSDLMTTKAEKDAKKNAALLTEGSQKHALHMAGLDDGNAAREDKREQRRKKAAGGKSGGGLQGREVKTKSTKKKGGRGREQDSDDEGETSSVTAKGRIPELEFMSVEEITEHLSKQEGLANCQEEFLTEISERLYRPLRRQYQEVAKSVFLQSTGASSSQGRKKTFGELQEKITGLWTNARLFEKGLRLFPDETQQILQKHLLKTVCSDICNLVLNAIATEQMLSIGEDVIITPEVRLKLLSKLPEDKTKQLLIKLHTSLNGKSLDEFFNNLDAVCSTGHLEITLKKPDKKKERQLVFNHRQALSEQLRGENDPAMALHLAVVLTTQQLTQCMVHAPGRCVPQIITYLQDLLPEPEHATFLLCQELVIKQLKQHSESNPEAGDSENAEDIKAQLTDLLPKVKDIALNAKKSKDTPED